MYTLCPIKEVMTGEQHFVQVFTLKKLETDLVADSYLMGCLKQEVGSGNTSQKSDEDDFVKVEDLPLQLTVVCEVSDALRQTHHEMTAAGCSEWS